MQEQDYLDSLCLPRSLYSEIENDVAELFTQQGIRSYPVDPMKIAVSLGYHLISFDKINDEAKKMLVSKGVDGISYYVPDKRTYVIYYKPDKNNERLRFTIGHEIGHIRMGHKCESNLAQRVANYYSAYLLAPTPWISFADCDDYKDISRNFCVSDSCANICFNRYAKWRKITHLKRYELKLLKLLS